MKTLLLLLISSIITFASVGKITSIKGEVYIDRNNQQISARVGSILEVKDKITTKTNSKAILLFNDNMSITVGKNSTMSVKTYVFDTSVVANNKATIGFGKGTFRTITGKLGKLNPRGFMIKTATATIGIRGSDGYTKVYPDGSVQHTTYSGGFVLTSNITGQTVWIPKGTTGRVDKDTIGVLPTTKKDLDEDDDLIGQDTGSNEENNDNDNSGDDVDDANEASTDASDASDDFDVEKLTQAELDEYITTDAFTLSDDYLTPSDTVNSKTNIATYSGNINGIYDDGVNTASTETGKITLNIDFGANTAIATMSNLSATANTYNKTYDDSSTLTDNSFSITETQDGYKTAGTIDGNFYGDNAGVAGGTFDLEEQMSGSANSTFKGSFGSIKD